MRIRLTLLALAASLPFAPSALGLAEFGIEGMGVVSTAAEEGRASVAPDGQRIVWSSDRDGGRHLWQATLRERRWADARPLALGPATQDFDPFFSADGRWLYFASERPGGRGGTDLYRVALRPDGGYGPAESLGPGVNTAGDERAPTLSADGARLLFASDGHGGAGGLDLFVARADGRAFTDARPVPGVNTAESEFDAAWLGEGRALVFARAADPAADPAAGPARLWVAQCGGAAYLPAQALALSFNGPEDDTRGAALDASHPGELLVAGSARAPRAGRRDLYRMKAPAATGQAGCLPPA